MRKINSYSQYTVISENILHSIFTKKAGAALVRTITSYVTSSSRPSIEHIEAYYFALIKNSID